MENGALLSAENHQWFNEQERKEQDRMNKLFQKYKIVCASIDIKDKKVNIEKLMETEIKDEDYPKEFRNKEIKLENKKYKNIAKINDDPEIMEV